MLLVDVALSLVVAVGEVVCGKYMMVTVSACVGRGNGNSIRNVKVKSRNELVLGRAFAPGICEQSFSVQIRHGSRNKTLSHYTRTHHTARATLRPL